MRRLGCLEWGLLWRHGNRFLVALLVVELLRRHKPALLGSVRQHEHSAALFGRHGPGHDGARSTAGTAYLWKSEWNAGDQSAGSPVAGSAVPNSARSEPLIARG